MLTTEHNTGVRFASRMADLGTETAFVVLAKARELERQGRRIVHLEIGEPDFATPNHIIEEAVKALRDGATHYGPAAGLPETRDAIARHVSQTRGVEVGPERVVVTPGAKPIMFFLILALIESGDEVIYPNPGFPIYESAIRFFGGRPLPIPLRESNDFRLDIEELLSLVTDKTKLIIINSPQNPTGGILTAEDLKVVGRLALDRGIYILADEIYSRIVYEGEFRSILHEVPEALDQVVLLDGMSKTFAMTGWRLGWGVMQPELAAAVSRLQTNCNSCTATFSQKVIGPALFGPQTEVEAMRREFQTRRDVIVDGLNAIPGFTCKRPSGAFYVFPNISALGMTSKEAEERLLNEAGVAALAGTSFGRMGEGYLRFSYANSVENISYAIEQITGWVKNL
ncbi:MAG: pyridoxal phosphate-dependent aminotransferase [Candidatus Zixiibacteriota bacterium]